MIEVAKRLPKARTSGTIEKRGESWRVRVFVGFDAAGKRVYRSQTVKGTKADAAAALAKLVTAKHEGGLGAATRETVGEFLERWLRDVAPQKTRDRTLRLYTFLIGRYVKPDLGAVRLVKLSPADVQAMISRLTSAARPRRLAPRTVRMAIGVLHNALASAQRMGLVGRNVTEGAELPRGSSKEMKALTPEEVARLFKATDTTPLATFFRLSVHTGARPSELLALRWADVRLDEQRIRIERTLATKHRGEEWRFEAPKTERSARTLPISSGVAGVLRAHRAEQAKRRLSYGSAYQGDADLVFATELGGPLILRNVVRTFKGALEGAKLPLTTRLYDLRHTAASLLLAAGQPVTAVSERLGHRNSAITLAVYSHALAGQGERAAEAMDRILGGGA